MPCVQAPEADVRSLLFVTSLVPKLRQATQALVQRLEAGLMTEVLGAAGQRASAISSAVVRCMSCVFLHGGCEAPVQDAVRCGEVVGSSLGCVTAFSNVRNDE